MEKRKKSWKDRRDGWYCTDVMGMNQLCIDLKPKRSLGELYINQKVDVTNLVDFISKKKKEHDKLTYFHAFVTTIGKVMTERPLLNRFVANRRIYEHKDLTISFVMKITFDDKSEEIMVILPINPDDTLYTISEKISKKVDAIRTKGDTGEGANDAIQVLSKLPNILRVPIVGLFKFFDKKGWLPKSLMKDNLYYSSMLVSNIGTFHCNGIYHNVTDFGTCSGILVMGEIKEEKENGKSKYYCEFGVTIDERIADGFYFIKSLKLMQYILNNPELLERRIDEKIDYKDKI